MTPSLASRSTLFESRTLSDIAAGQTFFIGDLVHLYLELKLGLQLDGNEAREASKTALRYIARAADAAFLTSDEFEGRVFEIHGRVLHLAIPYAGSAEAVEKLLEAAGCLHALLLAAYGSGGPDGWRMAADFGTTIAIQCPGIHGDTSIVSLSPAANRPAKRLGAKSVSVGELCYFNGISWNSESLDRLAQSRGKRRIERSGPVAASRPLSERIHNRRAQITSYRQGTHIAAKAAPVASPYGSQPSAADPMSRFGVVVSMDLDGFSVNVAKAAGSPALARQLAEDFYEIMLEAARFADEHTLDFLQIPFAGDNAIFVLVAKDHESYATLKKTEAVRVAVEWEERMGPRARASMFGGWAQVTAGGEVPHGNSSGNIHVARIEVENRGFLVAVGPGSRYAREGFIQLDLAPETLAMFQPDLKELHPVLRGKFRPCPSVSGATSANYSVADVSRLKQGLKEVEEQAKAVSKLSTVSVALGSGSQILRPYAGEAFLVKDHRGKTRLRPSAQREKAYRPELRMFVAALRNEIPDLRILREKKGIVQVGGTIRHDGADTRVLIEMDGCPLARPPKVFCQAPWVRRDLDWHFIPAGMGHKRGHFCWVLSHEWLGYFHGGRGASAPLDMQVQDAAIWLVSAMRLMLDRHHLSHRFGIEKWPEEWPQYSHGAAGVREFLSGAFRKP
jgi:hypothetical protein